MNAFLDAPWIRREIRRHAPAAPDSGLIVIYPKWNLVFGGSPEGPGGCDTEGRPGELRPVCRTVKRLTDA